MKKLLIVFTTMIIIVGCTKNKKPQTYKESFLGAFDTVHDVIINTYSQEEFDKYIAFYKEETQRLHNLYTTFDDVPGVNNLKVVNDQAGIKPVKVEQEIIDLLKDSIEWNHQISPNVNIALGPVLKIWHEYREAALIDLTNATIPSMGILKEANGCTNIDDIIIDEKEMTVFLPNSCMKLDVGSIAKGYAVEIVTQKLEAMGITSAAISAGGNVRTIGRRLEVKKDVNKDLPACAEVFCIALERPVFNVPSLDKDNPYTRFESMIAKAAVEDMSVVTSGDYQRFYIVDDQPIHHIIDSNTLMPATNYRAVTIITKDSGFADFMSSAIFLADFETGYALIESLEGVEAVWMFKDGTVKMSSGLIDGENIKLYEAQ